MWEDSLQIGYLQWHADRKPRLVLWETNEIPLDEMREILAKYEEVRK